MPEESYSQPIEEVKSDLSNNNYTDNVQLIPTRSTKIPTSKPPTNPLQFVKISPPVLFKTAHEQIKKVEVVKKVKEEDVKEEGGVDWQSNLDNWKCSRRKMQEHIIERVVEVKKLETAEEFDKQGRKNKTFSEMMEERTTKGRKSAGIPIYEDDSNDLSDLGLSNTSATNNNVDDDINGEKDIPPDKTDNSSVSNVEDASHKSSKDIDTNCTKVIQHSKSQPSLNTPRRSSIKIEQKINECTLNSQSNSNNKKPIDLPKIDVNRKKNIFEKGIVEKNDDLKIRKSVSSDNILNNKIKDRLTMFDKPTEQNSSLKKDKYLIAKVSVKERLSSIEKQNSEEKPTVHSTIPLQQLRNIQFENSNSEEKNCSQKSALKELKSSKLVKQTLSHIESINSIQPTEKLLPPPKIQMEYDLQKRQDNNEKEKIINKAHPKLSNGVTNGNYNENELTSNNEIDPNNKVNKHIQASDQSYITDTSDKCQSSDDEYKNNCTKQFSSDDESVKTKQFRHRSLDSLNFDPKFDSSFGRIQSFEELDFRERGGNYPASSLSGDTDREDSGIHTADVSSSVSQSDDYDTMSMGDMDVHHMEATNLSVIPEVQQESVAPITNQYHTVQNSSIKSKPVDETFETSKTVSFLKSDAMSYPDKSHFSELEPYVVKNNEFDISIKEDKIISTPVTEKRINDYQNCIIRENLNENLIMPETKLNISPSYIYPEETELYTTDMIVQNLDFPLDYSDVSKEPPKEPPPPPPGLSDDECQDDEQNVKTPLKRNDSTKRLKREIHLKRSSFLGIDGTNVDSYLEAEVQVKTPIDVVGLLANELQYRYSDYPFTFGKDNNRNTESDIKIEKLNDKYYNLIEDRNSNYSIRQQSVCSGDSGVASPSSTPQPQLEPEELYHNHPDEYIHHGNNNNQREHFNNNNFKQIKEKQIYKNNNMQPSDYDSHCKNANYNKIPKYNQRSQYYDNHDNLTNIEDRNSTIRNYIEDTNNKTNDYHSNQNELLYNETEYCNKNNNYKQNDKHGIHYSNQRDSRYEQSHHTDNQRGRYEQSHHSDNERGRYEQSHHTDNQRGRYEQSHHPDNQRDRYEQSGHRIDQTLFSNQHEYVNKDILYHNEEMYENLNQKYINRNGYDNGTTYDEPIINNKTYPGHYKNIKYDYEPNGVRYNEPNEYGYETNKYCYEPNDSNDVRNMTRRSLQDITQKSIALYENTVKFQDDFRDPRKVKQIDKQYRNVPAAGRSVPNLKDIEYRTSQSSANLRLSQTEPILSTSHSSSRIPKAIPNENNGGNSQAKRKSKQQGCLYNYNQHWLIQEAEHRRILEQQQRKSLTTQNNSNSKSNLNEDNTSFKTYDNTNHKQIVQNKNSISKDKSLPDAIIQNITRRIQHKLNTAPVRRPDEYESKVQIAMPAQQSPPHGLSPNSSTDLQHVKNINNFHCYNKEKMLSVSGKNKCSFCSLELGKGAAMIIESLHLFYHIHCFKCSVCCIQLGDGLMGTDVRVRNNKLHCQNCYSNDEGVKFSCV